MKKVILSALYVLSIVLAIGIGMSQMGKEKMSVEAFGAVKNCDSDLQEKDCGMQDPTIPCGQNYHEDAGGKTTLKDAWQKLECTSVMCGRQNMGYHDVPENENCKGDDDE